MLLFRVHSFVFRHVYLFGCQVHPPIFFWKFVEKSRLIMRRLLMATLSWVRENPKVVVYCPLFSSRERNVAEVRSAVVFCCQPNLKNMSQNAESFPLFQVNIQKKIIPPIYSSQNQTIQLFVDPPKKNQKNVGLLFPKRDPPLSPVCVFFFGSKTAPNHLPPLDPPGPHVIKIALSIREVAANEAPKASAHPGPRSIRSAGCSTGCRGGPLGGG